MISEQYNDVVLKAETLIEALPYIQKFNGKIVVVKYGGSAMLDPELKMNVIKDCALLKLVGMHPVIVHGGGKEISKWVSLLGHEPKFVEGLRVTDAETMEVAEMVLSKVNKSLVTMLEQIGVKAVGISGKDGGMLSCEKKYANGQDIGFVGNVTRVKPDIIKTMIENDYIPVIAPIGMDVSGNSYNINADDAACAIAAALSAEKLAFLTDIEGVYKDPKDPKTLLSAFYPGIRESSLRLRTFALASCPKSCQDQARLHPCWLSVYKYYTHVLFHYKRTKHRLSYHKR